MRNNCIANWLQGILFVSIGVGMMSNWQITVAVAFVSVFFSGFGVAMVNDLCGNTFSFGPR